MTLRVHLLMIGVITSFAGCSTLQHSLKPNRAQRLNNIELPCHANEHEAAQCSADEDNNLDAAAYSTLDCATCDASDSGCLTGNCLAGSCDRTAGSIGARNRANGDKVLGSTSSYPGPAGYSCGGQCGGRCGLAKYQAGFAMQNMGHSVRHAMRRVPFVARVADHARNTAEVGCYQGPPGPSVGAVTYPYYTTRGPRDFFLDNPPSIGP